MGFDWQVARDELGPAKVLLIHDPRAGLEACVVVDNTAAGPAIGGVRMAPDVSVGEVFRLARAMTFKNAAAGLAHGGGKAGIVADPHLSDADKERLVRAFGRAIRDLVEYIPGPDMGLTEANMAQLHDEMGRAVGLPAVLGGIPLDELGATGFGVAIAAEVVEAVAGIELAGARVAIQGYGAVGRHAARFLAERGALVVAVADSRGAIGDPTGLDLDRLDTLKADGRSVAEYEGATSLTTGELVALDCDLWIPAARPDVLTADNAASLKAKAVIQGANVPATGEAERILDERGVVNVPDFIANAGGVICAAVEYHGGTRAQAFAVIEERIRTNTEAVLTHARDEHLTPRAAAERLARERVIEAMAYRR